MKAPDTNDLHPALSFVYFVSIIALLHPFLEYPVIQR